MKPIVLRLCLILLKHLFCMVIQAYVVNGETLGVIQGAVNQLELFHLNNF